MRSAIGLLFGIGILLSASTAWADSDGCPRDSVRSGDVCIDKYEASVWEIPNAAANRGLIRKVRQGRATLADLTARGAIAHGVVQRGVALDDYGAGCPRTGEGCVDLYAVSIAGVIPSRVMTWFQAVAAARNSWKRLPTNAEWQAAALGTPDPGAGPGRCNVDGLGGPDLTGARAQCVSDVGAFDMVGNVSEWVGDWVPRSTNCVTPLFFEPFAPSPLFGDDANCLAGADTTSGPGALVRGGDFGTFTGFTGAGIFAIDGGFSPAMPNFVAITFGFRGARLPQRADD